MSIKKIDFHGKELYVTEDTNLESWPNLENESSINMAIEHAKECLERGDNVHANMHPIVQDYIIQETVKPETEDEPENQENRRILARNTNNRGEIVYRPKRNSGQKLWHINGTDVNGIQSIDEIMKASGLDFEVEKAEVFQQLPSGEYKPVNNQYHIRRSDNNAILTSKTVSDRYTPLQNRVFMDTLDALRSTGKLDIDTCGSINHGQKIFAIAKFTDLPDFDANNDPDMPSDIITPYMGIWSSHDGSLPVVGKFLSHRNICCNMSSAGWRNAGIRINIRHTKQVEQKVQDATKILLKIRENWQETVKMYKLFKERTLTHQELLKLIPKILAIKLDETKENPIDHLATKSQNRIIEIQDLYKDEYYGNYGKTAFDLYNAITAYNTHKRAIRGTTDRFDTNALGRGYEAENRAFKALSELPR